MPELLFEIGTEELPPNSISSLTTQVKENIITGLEENNISVNSEIKTFSTPRRIAVYIEGLPVKQKEEDIEVKGPAKENAYDKNGNPTQAAIGFTKKYNLEPKDLIIKKVNDTEYVFLKTKVGGQDTKKLLSKILPESIRKTTADKLMKWGNTDEKFVRPIRWILAVLDDQVIEFNYASIASSNYTYGHKTLGKENRITIAKPKNYSQELLSCFIIADPNFRKQKIIDLVKVEADKQNAIPENNLELLNEITNIVEYPGLILCKFDNEYLSLPECVIKTVLEKHQKYIVLYDKKNKKLLPNFTVITNGLEKFHKNKDLVIKNTKVGNEKVVKARLNDAKFFFEEDLKRPFTYEVRGKQLSKITFQKGLGSMEEKVDRIIKLSEHIYKNLNITKKTEITKEDLITTAKLCKLDLTTHMVFELPELQGYMGAEYARRNNYSELISKGISDHYYFPSFYEKVHHLTLSGLIISIADKIDNICCLYAIGKIPSGSTDPFALRRQAQGIITSIYYINKHFDPNIIINISDIVRYFKQTIANDNLKNKLTEEKENQLKQLILERFMSNLEMFDFEHEKDLVFAVCKTGDPLSDLISTHKKLTAIKESFYRPTEEFKKFLVAAKRLVRIVEPNINGNLDIKSIQTECEKQLLNLFEELNKKEYKTYGDLLTKLTILTEPINSFFDNVLVNDPDPKIKQTRQALLKKGKDLFEKICDFNQIQERN